MSIESHLTLFTASLRPVYFYPNKEQRKTKTLYFAFTTSRQLMRWNRHQLCQWASKNLARWTENQQELWGESCYFHLYQCIPPYFLNIFARICLSFFLKQTCFYVSVIFFWFISYSVLLSFLFILSFVSLGLFSIHFTFYFIYVHYIINNDNT